MQVINEDHSNAFCANSKKVKTWISIKDTPRENINFLFSLLDKLSFHPIHFALPSLHRKMRELRGPLVERRDEQGFCCTCNININESACLHIAYVDAVSCLHIVYVDATTCLHIVQVICCLVITWFCVNLPQLLQHQLRKFWACECLKTPNWCEWRFQTLRMGAKGDCGPCPQ